MDECGRHLPEGTVGSWQWQQGTDGSCHAWETVIGGFDVDCSGPPGGPFLCDCRRNGVLVIDESRNIPTWSFEPDCPSVAAWMDSGICQSVLDCCFNWYGASQSDLPPADHCSCIGDPRGSGFNSCDAAAASVGGTVVDLCTRYIYSGFPPID
jgi:hypothetical protein